MPPGTDELPVDFESKKLKPPVRKPGVKKGKIQKPKKLKKLEELRKEREERSDPDDRKYHT